MQRKRLHFTLKQHIQLLLGAFFVVLCTQVYISHYLTGVILTELDTRIGNFHEISQFLSGVEQELTALEQYHWENGDSSALLSELQQSTTLTNAYWWRIDGELDEIGEEQYLIYSAMDTTYQSYSDLLEQLKKYIERGDMDDAAQLYYDEIQDCGGYLRQYTQDMLKTSIAESQGSYEVLTKLNARLKTLQVAAVLLCLLMGALMANAVMQMLIPVQQMIIASNAISRGELDTPDIPTPKQNEMGQLASEFNQMKRSMAMQMNTLREKNEIESELHRQKIKTLELQNSMERSRLQQLRSQIDPHFLFNTLNIILQTASQEGAYRAQALIMALAHMLRYSLMSNDEQVPLAREVKVVDEYYSIYHVRFGERIKLRWCISESLDLTETMVPSFILQPIIENAFKHGISPKEEGGSVRIRINPLPQKGLLYINVCDNGCGIEPEKLGQLRQMLADKGQQWEHIGIYNVAARVRLIHPHAKIILRSKLGRGTSVTLYLPLCVQSEEDIEDDTHSGRG